MTLCVDLCCSAWSSAQEGGGRRPQLHGPQGDLEAPTVSETARPDPRLPGGLFQTGERGASRPAGHHGRLLRGRPGTNTLSHNVHFIIQCSKVLEIICEVNTDATVYAHIHHCLI